jgi:CheY-like chemotaxis protein
MPSSPTTTKSIVSVVNQIPHGSGDVLVVDDVVSNLRMNGRVMEGMGFIVEYAENGKEAVDKCVLKMAVGDAYTVILMDNMMPVMTGREATRQLRAMGYNGIIVGVTGNVLIEDLEEFSQAGCNEVITKPLDPPELKRTLHSLGLSVPNKVLSSFLGQ